ncbi:hypothetical protein [Mycolicibacterium mengxianglii]|uniref:hypothetical protein n=1 Tax=Mycolicibacterium mengxianglii TaxID=2736649 RepID=UPI0018EF2AB9|nr:hypothetical protein [Mycolicibacterium mengxianglii]
MKKFGFTSLGVTALTAGYLGVVGLAAPAMATPSAVTNAQDTINSLEAEGYDVIVNRLSTTPLDRANVVSVGPGRSVIHSEANATTHAELYGPVTRNTVYVSVK